MKSHYLFTLLLLPVLCFSQGTWKWQNPWPQGTDLLRIKVINKNKIIATGQAGTVIITENGGINWRRLNLPTDHYKRLCAWGVDFQDSLHGYVVCLKNIYRTNDGGYSWEDATPLISATSPVLRDIKFLNMNNGWLLTSCNKSDYFNDPEHNSSKLYKTWDQGATWHEVVTSAVGVFEKMCIPDSLSCFILSEAINDNYLVRSLDGGQTWEKKVLPTLSISLPYSLYFVSAMHGWFGRYVTTDGGDTWQPVVDMLSEEETINELYFINETTGWMTTNYGIYRQDLDGWTWRYRIYNTNNGGRNWVVQKENIVEQLEDIHFIDELNGWICGKSGALYKTENGGQEWTRITRGNPWYLHDLDFVDENNGWAVGEEGTILATKNGGQTWIRQESSLTNTFKAVDFIDQNNGWIAGDRGGGIILHTNNGGDRWEIQFDNKELELQDITFVDNLHGWAVGKKGLIITTENGGATWITQSSDINVTLAAVCFLDTLNGWVCGNSGTVLSTINGGTTWSYQQIGFGFLRSIQFVNEYYGWCSDKGDGSFYYTMTGGRKWQQRPVETYMYDIICFQSFFFINNSTGWAGDFCVGDIAKTTDCGLTWTFLERLNFAGIVDIDFVDEKAGWVISSNSILHYKEDDTYIDQNKSAPSNKDFQVFPNPFNSTTTIYFKLDKSQDINIRIYDVLGRQVTTLLRGKLEKGEHKTIWQAENIPSGLYFVTVEGADFKQIIKCSVVK